MDGEQLGAPPEVLERLRANLVERWVPSQLEIAAIFYHQTDPETARWLGERTLSMPVNVAERYLAQLADIDFRHRINDVDLPVLAMWGMHDQLIDPQWADWFDKRALPGWRVERLEHSGHGSLVDEPARVADLLRAFIG